MCTTYGLMFVVLCVLDLVSTMAQHRIKYYMKFILSIYRELAWATDKPKLHSQR
jgi:hypothetical protein